MRHLMETFTIVIFCIPIILTAGVLAVVAQVCFINGNTAEGVVVFALGIFGMLYTTICIAD